MLRVKCVFGAFALLVLCLLPRELDAQDGAVQIEPKTSRFQTDNILVNTREKLHEIDIHGNKIQEFAHPKIVKESENTYLESIYGAAFADGVLCDSDGVAWMLMEARRIEAEPEKFVEWAYEGYCLASLDSRSGQFRINFLHDVPTRNSGARPVIRMEKEDIIIHSPSNSKVGEKTFRVDKQSREIRDYVLKKGAKKIDFRLFAMDGKGTRYRPGDRKLQEREDFLIETPKRRYSLNLKREFNIQSMSGLNFHPSGKLIMCSNRKEVLIAEIGLEPGTINVLHEVALNASYSSSCVVGEQDE